MKICSFLFLILFSPVKEPQCGITRTLTVSISDESNDHSVRFVIEIVKHQSNEIFIIFV